MRRPHPMFLGLSLAALTATGVLAQTSPGIAPSDDQQMEQMVEEALGSDTLPPAVPDSETPPLQQAMPQGQQLPSDPSGAASGEPTMAELSKDAVNGAAYQENVAALHGASPIILKLQILLDRANASPGVIDSYFGENVAKAIATLEAAAGLPVDGRIDPRVWQALGAEGASPVLVDYTITEEDLQGPFQSIPEDYSEQAEMEQLGFTSPAEMLAERFHMDIDLLKALNPNADFSSAGTTIVVAAPEGQSIEEKITTIEADKARAQVRAYDPDGRLIAAYPATIGSQSTPSPSGTHEVKGIAPDPVYYYDPENFVQGDNHEKLQLPPGPNNPVGSVWIDLTEEGYGIHGTPEPAAIDKTASHGCIRLTNWDAEELAGIVEVGATVEFLE